MGDVEREVHSARMLGCEISTNPLDPLEPILKMCEYHHPDEDISILERAYERAVKQHSSQRRKSGEPYIIHPLAVAQILADLGMGPLVVAAGLLHDTVEDTDYTLDQCRDRFGRWRHQAFQDGIRRFRASRNHSQDGGRDEPRRACAGRQTRRPCAQRAYLALRQNSERAEESA